MKFARTMGDILVDYFQLAGKVVADVGCGTGDLTRWLAGQGASVTGLDTPRLLAMAAATPRLATERYLPGAGENLPLDDCSADLVIFAASLHHVPADRLDDALAECRRVLKAGGHGVFIEPVPQAGSYYEISRLPEDEAEILKSAYAAILRAAAADLPMTVEALYYFERSFADYSRMIEVHIEGQERQADILARARAVTERLAAAAGKSFAAFRFRSICRLNILQKQ